MASILTLVESARQANRIPPEVADSFSNGLQSLRDDYAARGGNYKELLAFRNSEIAHSLQRHSEPSGKLFFEPLLDLTRNSCVSCSIRAVVRPDRHGHDGIGEQTLSLAAPRSGVLVALCPCKGTAAVGNAINLAPPNRS